MKIALIARFSRQEEMREIKADLQVLGHEVISNWFDGTQIEGNYSSYADYAGQAWDELLSSDCSIHFTEDPANTSIEAVKRGGRHVEAGVALMMHRNAESGMTGWFGPPKHRIIVVGYRENVFHYLRQIEFYASWDDCFEQLADESVPR